MSEDIRLLLSALCILAILGILYWRLAPLIFFKSRAIKAKGKITNWMSASVKRERIFKPIIQYHDAEGKEQSFVSDDQCKGEPAYPIGTEVTVYYNPKDPNQRQVEYPEK